MQHPHISFLCAYFLKELLVRLGLFWGCLAWEAPVVETVPGVKYNSWLQTYICEINFAHITRSFSMKEYGENGAAVAANQFMEQALGVVKVLGKLRTKAEIKEKMDLVGVADQSGSNTTMKLRLSQAMLAGPPPLPPPTDPPLSGQAAGDVPCPGDQPDDAPALPPPTANPPPAADLPHGIKYNVDSAEYVCKAYEPVRDI